MGTRSNTLVIEAGHDKEFVLVNIYRQMDGYPSGMGRELADFISKTKMVNGIGIGQAEDRIANGAGCFAAQLIAQLKDGPGGIYIDSPAGECDNDYTYKIRIDTFNPRKAIGIEVFNWGKRIFKGNAARFIDFCAEKVAA